ncbi:hypothetical protein PVAP13_3NG213526 [Panicum virgatum]|uniref:Uncharacterized protein n=1 Tax=Panicum virgatum TaxID=38727 RepID=A0A8T0UFI3_PANVG|nr:hypothetical protein PVAP13_3NG213526 [Panicum virgatum]
MDQNALVFNLLRRRPPYPRRTCAPPRRRPGRSPLRTLPSVPPWAHACTPPRPRPSTLPHAPPWARACAPALTHSCAPCNMGRVEVRAPRAAADPSPPSACTAPLTVPARCRGRGEAVGEATGAESSSAAGDDNQKVGGGRRREARIRGLLALEGPLANVTFIHTPDRIREPHTGAHRPGWRHRGHRPPDCWAPEPAAACRRDAGRAADGARD